MKCNWSHGYEKCMCFILGILKDQNPFLYQESTSHFDITDIAVS